MDKIVLITGATCGIDEACALEFAEHQFNLIIAGRRKDKLKSLADRLTREFGIKCLPIELDVLEKKAVSEILEALPEQWRNVDVLMNNADLCFGLDPVHSGSTDDWDVMIDTNLKGLL